MATTLYFRASNSPAPTMGIDMTNNAVALSNSAGVTGGVNNVPTSDSPPTYLLYNFMSEPLAAAVTISGTISFQLYAKESSMSANAAIGAIVYAVSGATRAVTEIGTALDNAELGTSIAAMTFTMTPTSTALAKGDRIFIRILFNSAPGVSMGSGYTTTCQWGDASGTEYYSYVTFNETLSFLTFSGAQYLYPTNVVSGVSGSGVDYQVWTSRGASAETLVTNTITGNTSPIKLTETAGGSAVTFWTPRLQAVTLSGIITVVARAEQSGTSYNTRTVCEVAVTDADGSSNITVYGASAAITETSLSESPSTFTLAGPDINITTGQRLRIRFFIDDVGPAMVEGGTHTLYYNGGISGDSGDTYLHFPVTLSAWLPSDPPFTPPNLFNHFVVR